MDETPEAEQGPEAAPPAAVLQSVADTTGQSICPQQRAPGMPGKF